jgi:hypothetical protein
MHLTYRQTCRVCGSSALTKVVDLGEQLNQGTFVSPTGEIPSQRKIPLVLLRCDPTRDENACGLLQTQCTVPPEILYPTYWYRSGTNRTMRDHLRDIVEDASHLIALNKANVLDIGCNDGTLLSFYPAAYEKYGIDPSNAIDDVQGNDFKIIHDIFPSDELRATVGDNYFDIITSIAMFYDLEDPVSFAKSIQKILSPAGIWTFEMSYMPSMLRTNSYDTICHEHLEYYSLAVVESVLSRAGLKLVNATLNEINGGSVSCTATHLGSGNYRAPEFQKNLDLLRLHEFDLSLETDRPYASFQERIEKHRDELSGLLRDLKRQGMTIHVYGASTKGNTILQYCGLDDTVIDYAADRNPAKHGGRTVGTNIPIISEEESRAMVPDFYLALPWHFRPEFVEREAETIERGTCMIFPLPSIQIVGTGTRANLPSDFQLQGSVS